MASNYGEDITTVARVLGSALPQTDDPSYDVLVFLSAAYAAASRLKEKGANLSISPKQPILISTIERAYREALYVRLRIPVAWLNVDILTRFGRLVRRNGV